MADAKAASAADSSGADAAVSVSTKLMDAMLSRIDAMQTDFKKSMDDITSASRSFQHTATVGSTAVKQDVGGDESQSAGISLDAGNKRSFDNFAAWQALRFADRDRVHFDNMQALGQLAFSNVTFALGLSQNLTVADTHQQCGRNADWRSATIASKHESKE